jgi:PAS domain S-box-containing protein
MEHDAALDTLRAIIDCSPLAIVTLSPEGNVQSWNPAAERIFGWSEAEALHRPFPSVQAEDAEKYREILRKTLGGDHLSNLQLRQSRRDGSTVFVTISAAPLRDDATGMSGALLMVADATARRLDEETNR